ncbi:MAG: ABC transporter substrate-binding protein [Chloroflexi bacterium]|nr:ABC transporter substrate-binding protein [Chloroflexota bacterium]
MPGLVLLALTVLALLVVGCAQQAPQAGTKGPVTVGAKADTEGALLQQVIVLMLKQNGFQVVEKPQITGTPLIRKALMSGELDIYPEYTGNGAFFFDETKSDVWMNAKVGYERVKKLDKEKNNIIWLKPAPANNTWAIAARKDLAQKEKLRTLDDLAAYINKGGQAKLAGSEEFVTSEVALPAFKKAYGFDFKKEQLLVLAGGNTAQTEKAAADGTDGVNLAMAYGTDGSLSALNLVVLEDPRGVQPVYEPAPIVRGEVFNKYPELETVLGPVFESLSLETLQTLNARIAIEGQKPADVARAYLTSKGFLK